MRYKSRFDKKCRHCGAEYVAQVSRSLYCSKRCQTDFHNALMIRGKRLAMQLDEIEREEREEQERLARTGGA